MQAGLFTEFPGLKLVIAQRGSGAAPRGRVRGLAACGADPPRSRALMGNVFFGTG
jgi:hypothetical protein